MLAIGGSRADEAPSSPDALLASLDRCFSDPRVQARKAQDEPDDPWGSVGFVAPAAKPGEAPAKNEREETLVDLCPDLHAAITSSELAPFLPPDWAVKVTLAKLQRFRTILTKEWPAAADRPDPAAVAGIVAQVRQADVVKRRTLWQRIRDWIRQRLLRQSSEAESNWLADWLRENSPSDRAMRWTFNTLLVILTGLIAWIVYVELRAAGLLDRTRRQRRERRAVAIPAGASATRISLEDASETELPALLIARLLGELRRHGRAEDRHSMTRCELERAVRFDNPREANIFRELLLLAERLRYDRAAPAPAPAPAPAIASLRCIVDDARRMLESLASDTRAAA